MERKVRAAGKALSSAAPKQEFLKRMTHAEEMIHSGKKLQTLVKI